MSAEPTKPADFSTVLASAVHDMKNSLWLLMEGINKVADQLNEAEGKRPLADIQYEAQRLNTSLVQLLSLYRSEQQADGEHQGQVQVSLEEQFLDELAEELVDANEFYAKHHEVKLAVEIESDLAWFLDKNLVTVILHDVVINAMRYAKSKVTIKAFKDQASQQLCIQIIDDGSGYPEDMLIEADRPVQDSNLSAGRTGLGLYFARRIAAAHKNNQGHGIIVLKNAASGGSIFELRLP